MASGFGSINAKQHLCMEATVSRGKGTGLNTRTISGSKSRNRVMHSHTHGHNVPDHLASAEGASAVVVFCRSTAKQASCAGVVQAFARGHG